MQQYSTYPASSRKWHFGDFGKVCLLVWWSFSCLRIVWHKLAVGGSLCWQIVRCDVLCLVAGTNSPVSLKHSYLTFTQTSVRHNAVGEISISSSCHRHYFWSGELNYFIILGEFPSFTSDGCRHHFTSLLPLSLITISH